MFYVYVLQSLLYSEQLYVGSTVDLENRLSLHNDGKMFSTKRYKPWKIIYYEAYSSEKLARKREQRLKHHGNAMKELKKRITEELKPKNGGVYPAPKHGAGFTLIELLVTMAVLGVLASGLIIAINPAEQFKRNRDAQRKNDIAQLKRALETYYSDYGRYPQSSNSPDYLINALICGASPCQWGSSFGPYMVKLPIDPVSSKIYRYVVSDPNGQSYRVYASLDRKNLDYQVCNPDGNAATDDPCANVPPGVTCGTGSDICNYGVSSPNVSP